MSAQHPHNAAAFSQTRLMDYAIPDYSTLLLAMTRNGVALRGDPTYRQSFVSSLDMNMWKKMLKKSSNMF